MEAFSSKDCKTFARNRKMNKLSVLKNKGYWFVAESTTEGFPWKIAITFNKTGMVLSASSITTSDANRKKQRQTYNCNYNEKHREEHEKGVQDWRKKNPEKFAEMCRRRNYKRYRNLGFEPLNEWFPGSEAHHINENEIIYIPEELHRSVYHELASGIGMEEINKLAFEFLESPNYDYIISSVQIKEEKKEIGMVGKKRSLICWEAST